LKNLEEADKEEKRIVLYLLGTSISYTALVGGLLVFILLVVNVDMQILAGSFSAYLTFSLALIATFLHRPLSKFNLRKFFLGGSGLFLIMSSLLFLEYFSIF